jgi:glutamate-ammonia-ligase adenylyltransferase
MRPDFAALKFEDPGKAAGNLERLEEQLAPTLLTPLASLLSQSPDPDGALNLLERYAQGAPPQVLGELARYPAALSYLVAIFGYSGYLAETLLSEPQLVVQFARDRNFTKLKSKEDLMQDFARFSTTNPDPWLAALLARFKRRNYLRIVLKDVLRLSTLGETTLELSTLADVILSDAYLFCDRELEKRYGQPQYRDAQGRIVRAGFSIVSLGKLGGNELNYNSDIDLLFLYSHDGETAGGSERESIITNKEYFVHVAHAITRTITQATSQGEVFRVDLRLRPEGEQGDLAISLSR